MGSLVCIKQILRMSVMALVLVTAQGVTSILYIIDQHCQSHSFSTES